MPLIGGEEEPRELVRPNEDGGKGLEEVTPIPIDVELDISFEEAIELRLIPVPGGTEFDELTPVGGFILLELISVPKEVELEALTLVCERVALELTPVPGNMELGRLAPVP